MDGKIFITQYFGNTAFATANPQVYNGAGHNGIDFRAAVGAPIKAAKDGVVKGVGDTDKNCNGVSYGKWVLIEHPNNLLSYL
ncbi:MAG: peptidoglycan DD-metalloendopeptidase family protein [Candidatus Paceibacterota bacterium]